MICISDLSNIVTYYTHQRLANPLFPPSQAAALQTPLNVFIATTRSADPANGTLYGLAYPVAVMSLNASRIAKHATTRPLRGIPAALKSPANATAVTATMSSRTSAVLVCFKIWPFCKLRGTRGIREKLEILHTKTAPSAVHAKLYWVRGCDGGSAASAKVNVGIGYILE